MSNEPRERAKKLFLSLCGDAVEMYHIGMDEKTFCSNISFLAEQQGVSTFSAITIAETMHKSIRSLSSKGSDINLKNISLEFLSLTNKQ